MSNELRFEWATAAYQRSRAFAAPNYKHYNYDPKATSGYVNGIHISVLGPEVADATTWHAAAIRDPQENSGGAPPSGNLPPYDEDGD
ncbi:hypothetical protein [Streptomyces sp. NPDC093589]|uniref:hypothetical protein n=1 Tax=Streptomyces sp. NPDC093589 TaxID=3366043 RepID=UPI00381A4D81